MEREIRGNRGKKAGWARRAASCLACAAWCAAQVGMRAYAATDLSVFTDSMHVFYELVAAVISSIGLIIALWGISEFGISFQGSDGTMQAYSFKRIAGGLVMVFAPQLLPLLVPSA